MNRRLVLGLTGGAALAAAVLAAEGVAALAPTAAAVAAVGNDYLLVAGLAGLVGALGLAAAASGRAGTVVQADLPEPERRASVPRPGDGLEASLRRRRHLVPVVGRQERAAVHARLRAAAVGATVRTTGCDRATARERVAAGSWTDDEAVAAFLAPSAPPTPSHRARLASLIRGESWFARRARRAAETVAAVGEAAG